MKIKIDENKNAVLIDDNPVYVDSEGKDIAVDVSLLYSKISSLNNESASRRRELNDIKDKFKVFTDIEDVNTWFDEANKAISTVQNLSDKKLVDANKVEELKTTLKQQWEDKLSNITNEKDSLITKKDNQIYKLLVSSQFATSNQFSGEKPITILLPDIAESYFGKNFKVEENSSGKLAVVGYLNDNKIYSRANPGEAAPFSEAISEIINNYPMKDRILKAGNSGSGADGNQDNNDSGSLSKLKSQYKSAKEIGNITLAISLKNQIHALELK